MRGWWQEISEVVLPSACGGCGRSRTALCAECAEALCGGPVRRARPDPEPPGLPAVWGAAAYEDAVRAVLLAHKERGALGLAGALGRALATAVRAAAGRSAGEGTLLLVPVPSSRGAVRARGHDAGRRIACAASAELRRSGTPARMLGALRQRRAVADQAGLDAPQRLANLSGALEVVPGGVGLLDGGRVVLVDDLMTTGASLVEAARAVRAVPGREFAGATEPVAAVVAAPPLSFEINRN